MSRSDRSARYPGLASRITTTRSSPAAASLRPSGSQATPWIDPSWPRKARISSHAVVSQSTMWSVPPDANREPSPLQEIDRTWPVWPRKTTGSAPVSGSQIRMVESSPPEASRRPSGLHASARDAAVWPTSDRTDRPVRGSQMRTLPSPSADARREPSRDQATAWTSLPWPCSTIRPDEPSAVKIRMIVSQPAAASRRPSGLQASDATRFPSHGIAHEPALPRVPDADMPVVAVGRQPGPVGAPRHAMSAARAAVEGADRVVALGIPDPDDPIPELDAIRRPSGLHDRESITPVGLRRCRGSEARIRIPDPDRAFGPTRR